MSSSPEQPGVESFEYQEALDVVGVAAAPANAPAFIPGRASGSELQRRLAEAREQGAREGLQQAQQGLQQQIAQERAKVAEAVMQFQRRTSEYYSRAEVELVHLALGIARKILHRESQVDRMLVAGLVRVALEKLQQGTKVAVHVRPEEMVEWSQYFQESPAGSMLLQVMADPAVEARNCVLETELGATQVGLEAQLKEIEQGFFDLLAQRPDAK
jgi:flagellar assembly protein FliH